MATQPKRTDIDVDRFRRLLLEERANLIALHRHNAGSNVEEARSHADEEAHDHTQASGQDGPENYDGAPVMFDDERFGALDENVRQTIYEIDAALARIDSGDYGLDETTGEPIPVERLEAVPWATLTVENAALRDK